jgi:hypothetical protein
MVRDPVLNNRPLKWQVVRIILPVCLVDSRDGVYLIRPVGCVPLVFPAFGVARGHGVARGAHGGGAFELARDGAARPGCSIAQCLICG